MGTTPMSLMRVTKTYRPGRAGAKRFAKRYGQRLVCVRHRLDATGTMRYTTVELVVERTPVVAPEAHAPVAVRVPADAKALRKQLLASGAQWKPRHRYWLLPRIVAGNLRLLRYIVPTRT